MWKKVRTSIAVYIYLAGMIGFTLFIIEEASQIATFSTFMSRHNHDLTLMLKASELMDVNNQLIININKYIGWINPFSYISYNKYAEAQDLYSNVIKYHILAHQPKLLEGKALEFDFTPHAIENGMMVSGQVKVVSARPQLSTIRVKGIVQNGKVLDNSTGVHDQLK